MLRGESKPVLKNVAGIKLDGKTQQRCRRRKQRHENQALDEAIPRNPACDITERNGEAGTPKQNIDGQRN